MPQTSTTPILIVGAGPVGLTLANLLARQGVEHRLIDLKPGPVQQSRATDIHARTLELLTLLGLADAFIERGAISRGVHFFSDGHSIAHFNTHDLDSRYPFILGLAQSDTEALLVEHLTRQGGAVAWQTELLGFTQRVGSVQAHLRGPGGEERVEARFLVGADGANSAVRQRLGLPFEGLSYDEDFMLADVSLRWERPHDELHLFFGPRGFANVLPMPGTERVRLFVDLPEGQRHREPTLDTFKAILDERLPAKAHLYDPGWMSRFRLHRRMVPRYRVGRVFLAGDAAHIHSPVGGQGMNMGIQDAFNLAWKLAAAARGQASEDLLESYHAERHAVGDATLLKTDLATRMSTARHPWLLRLRDHLSPVAMAVPGVQRWVAQAIAALDVNFRHSPVVAASRSSLLSSGLFAKATTETPSFKDWFEFGFGPEAGDRAPDRRFGPPEHERRCLDLLSDAHTLLLFDGAVDTDDGYRNLAAIADAVRARHKHLVDPRIVLPHPQPPPLLDGRDDLVLDHGGDLHCAFGARAECLYLIRPDGYIAFRAQPASLDALEGYLGRVFTDGCAGS